MILQGCGKSTITTSKTDLTPSTTVGEQKPKLAPTKEGATAALKTCLDSWIFGDSPTAFSQKNPSLIFNTKIELRTEYPTLHKYEIISSRRKSAEGDIMLEYQFAVSHTFISESGNELKTSLQYTVSSTDGIKWSVSIYG
jgi:hypothetical protein